MEVMVEQFQEELLPVAAQLTSRLVRCLFTLFSLRFLFGTQCESYLRLARESSIQDSVADSSANDLESVMADADDDKTYAAMGVAKTIYTVRMFF